MSDNRLSDETLDSSLSDVSVGELSGLSGWPSRESDLSIENRTYISTTFDSSIESHLGLSHEQ